MELDKDEKNGRLEKILERHADWAPEMTESLRHGDLDGLKHWMLSKLPVSCDWEHNNGQRAFEIEVRRSHESKGSESIAAAVPT